MSLYFKKTVMWMRFSFMTLLATVKISMPGKFITFWDDLLSAVQYNKK